MLNSRYFILIPLLLFLGAAFGIAIQHEPLKWSIFFLLHLPLLIVTLPSRLIFIHRKNLGYFHYAVSCVSLFLLLVISCTNPHNIPLSIPPEFIAYPFIASSASAFISFFLAVPATIIPFFRGHLKANDRPPNSLFDISFVIHGFENIKRDFQRVQEAIVRETSGIDDAIDEFQKNLQSQADELERAQKELARTKEEIKEYETLVSLTKEQQDTLLSVLGRRKYIEYLVGFILGIISSAMVEWFPSILDLFLK